MTNPTEIVARASFKCWRNRMTQEGYYLDRGMTFEDMDESEQAFAVIHAESVIAAHLTALSEAGYVVVRREPTEAMLAYFGNGEALKWAPGIWQAMIEASLSEKEDGK